MISRVEVFIRAGLAASQPVGSEERSMEVADLSLAPVNLSEVMKVNSISMSKVAELSSVGGLMTLLHV